MTESAVFYSPCSEAFLVLCWLINVYLVVRLWRVKRADPIGRKLIWSVILVLLPILGLIFYAGFYQAPKPCSHEKDDSSGLIG